MKNRPSEKFWRGVGYTILALSIMGWIALCIFNVDVLIFTTIAICIVALIVFSVYFILSYKDYKEHYPHKRDLVWYEVNPKYNIIWRISKFLDRNYEK